MCVFVDYHRQRANSLDEDFSDLYGSKPTPAASSGGGWETVSAAPGESGSLFASAMASMQNKKEGEDEVRRQYL